MKWSAAIACTACVALAGKTHAVELDLATLTCGKYESEILPAAAANPAVDSINTVMWLYGYSVARSGARAMYPEALAPFGFALDGECKTNPGEHLLDALSIVKPEAKNPLNLMTLQCGAFATRHVELARTDPESANTIMMWLFGFSVAKSGSSLFDADSLGSFQTKLLAHCAKQPNLSLFDGLTAIRFSRTAK